MKIKYKVLPLKKKKKKKGCFLLLLFTIVILVIIALGYEQNYDFGTSSLDIKLLGQCLSMVW